MRLGPWIVGLVGCYDPTYPANVACSPLGECPGALICRDGRCVDNHDAGVDAFVVVPGTVSVALAGNGTGAVTSSPSGIDCPGACSAAFPSGTKVELTAVATGDSWFSGWAGSCAGTGRCSVVSDDGASLVATFPLNRHTLTVAKSGDGSGIVTSEAGIDCGATCAADFDSGTSITLTATGTSDSSFTGWAGACSGTAPCTVDMSQARDVTATFDCPSGSATFNYTGAPATLTGRPACVTRLVVDVRGASGGGAYYRGARGSGGKGGRTQATIDVATNDVITVVVGNVGGDASNGAAGGGGYNGGANGGASSVIGPQFGGGGGGASDLRRNGTAFADRIVVAAGGGGAGTCSGIGYAGGDGGGLTGGNPATSCIGSTTPTGGTQTAGGSGGSVGGYCTAAPGTAGNGGASCSPGGGGGGGGGWFGGGGGVLTGGAGGSSYAIGGATSVTHTPAAQTGAGQVIITW